MLRAVSIYVLFVSLTSISFAWANDSDELSEAEIDKLIEAVYYRNNRAPMPADFVAQYRQAFLKASALALTAYNNRLALKYDGPRFESVVDFGFRGVAALAGVGLSAEAGLGWSTSITHFGFPVLRLHLGAGEGWIAMILFGQVSKTRGFPFSLFPLGIDLDRVFQGPIHSSEAAYQLTPDLTDEALLIGVSSRNFSSDGSSDSAGAGLGYGQFRETARLTAKVGLPLYLPTLPTIYLKMHELTVERVATKLRNGDLLGAHSILVSGEAWARHFRSDPDVNQLRLLQVDKLPALHPLASIPNLLNSKSLKPLPTLRTCLGLITGIVTGKV